MFFNRIIIVLSLSILQIAKIFAQQNQYDSQMHTVIINGDTMQSYQAKPILILPTPVFPNNDDLRKFKKLVRNLKVVYPYAKMGKAIFQDVERAIDSIPNKRLQNIYIKQRESELMSKYREELEHLSVTQGQLLMKLMDREVNKTTFEIVKQLRGSMQAFMWQQLARLFGSNLKTGYDPKGEDQMIEKIVILIENGQL